MKIETLPTLPELATSLGFSIASTPPVGAVDPAHGKDGKPWPHILYASTITRNGKPVWSGPYKLGVGHVEISQREVSSVYRGPFLTEREGRLAQALVLKPSATVKDAALHASLAAKLAARQKVAPTLAAVLHSLLSDGQAHFDILTFAEWCGEFGYDTDSRSAEETFSACIEIGRSLARAIPAAELAQLRDAASDF